MTADEIRKTILDAVSKNGGHLSSSLGAVELSMALAKVFDPAEDRIVWDVGHQSYAWKILTGRADRFGTLRTHGGISGFPNPAESPCDAAIAGHAGVALSVATGMAAARDRTGGSRHVVAVVGDASLANGACFEAMDNCANSTRKVILVLNDNGMSISKPVGSFSRFLGRLISNVRYNRVKSAAEKAGHAMRLTFLRGAYHNFESRLKSLFLGNRFFERYGLRYIGPVDGHDLQALEDALTVAKEDKRSVIVHVVTQKGKGFAPAEKDPTRWHGVGPFDIDAALSGGEPFAPAKGVSWSDVFGRALCRMAEKDGRIAALTAAMKDGTGLTEFAKRFPERFFDTGIAEGHLLAFAAGLAAGGMRPVVPVYSTFLQRAMDEIMHDICIAKVPVVICADRAGVVGQDGVTHQGVFDIAMLRALPNLAICQPKDAKDLEALLEEALRREGPTLIRYPRGVAPESVPEPAPPSGKPLFAIWATGDWYPKAVEVAAAAGGIAVHARYLKPFDAELLAKQRAEGMKIVSLENGSAAGGFGEAIGADLRFGWPDEFIPHGRTPELEVEYGLDAASVAASVKEFLWRTRTA